MNTIKMRFKLFVVVCTIVSALLCLCGQFPDRFERIETDRLRVIAFSFAPTREAAPGDTMHLTMHFAGNPVETIDSFEVSYDVLLELLSNTDTIKNLQSLGIIEQTTYLPDSMVVSFKVPDTVLSGLMEKMAQQMDLDPNLVPALISMLANPSVSGGIDAGMLSPELIPLINALSAKAYLYATARSENGSRLRIRSSFNVRFNRLLQNVPELAVLFPVNRPHDMTWIGVYTVNKPMLFEFDPADPEYEDEYTFQYLYHKHFPDSVKETIVIDTGKSYFLAADSGLAFYEGDDIPEELTLLDSSTIVIESGGIRSRITLGPADYSLNPLRASEMVAVFCDTGKNPTVVYVDSGDILLDVEDSQVRFAGNEGGGQEILSRKKSSVNMTVTTLDFGITYLGTPGLEAVYYTWMFQNTTWKESWEDQDSAVILVAMGNSVCGLFPPVDTRNTEFKVWVKAEDIFTGDAMRPITHSVRSIEGRFAFTKEYIKEHKDD